MCSYLTKLYQAVIPGYRSGVFFRSGKSTTLLTVHRQEVLPVILLLVQNRLIDNLVTE